MEESSQGMNTGGYEVPRENIKRRYIKYFNQTKER
jgi:predicted ABC-type ATPase